MNGGRSRSRIEVVHALPWRVHLRTRALIDEPGAGERIARRLAEWIDFDSISIRPITGSVVVVRKAGGLETEDIAHRLSELLESERNDHGRPLGAPRGVKGPSKLARAVARAMRKLNARVAEELGGEADLRILVPTLLAAASAVEPIVSGEISLPPWSALVWYSVREFSHHNRDAFEALVDEDTRETE